MVQLRFCAYQYANLRIEGLVARWLRAEELGFDVIWNCDTLNEPDVPRAAMFEATSILAAMATSTTRIRVGTLVNTLIYRNPAVVAKTAMTIDHLSNGRLELGFGGGVLESDHRASGIEWWDARERVRGSVRRSRSSTRCSGMTARRGQDASTRSKTLIWLQDRSNGHGRQSPSRRTVR